MFQTPAPENRQKKFLSSLPGWTPRRHHWIGVSSSSHTVKFSQCTTFRRPTQTCTTTLKSYVKTGVGPRAARAVARACFQKCYTVNPQVESNFSTKLFVRLPRYSMTFYSLPNPPMLGWHPREPADHRGRGHLRSGDGLFHDMGK